MALQEFMHEQQFGQLACSIVRAPRKIAQTKGWKRLLQRGNNDSVILDQIYVENRGIEALFKRSLMAITFCKNAVTVERIHEMTTLK